MEGDFVVVRGQELTLQILLTIPIFFYVVIDTLI